jgi:hypothetical protein
MSLTYDLNVSGKTTLENVSCKALTATSLDVTGTTQILGNVNLCENTGTALTIYKGLTPQYRPSSLASTQIGYIVEDPLIANKDIATSGDTSLTDAINLTTGVWLISYNVRFVSSAPSTITALTVFINYPFGTLPTSALGQNTNNSTMITSLIGYTGTGIVTVETKGIYKLLVNMTYSGGTLTCQTDPTVSMYSRIQRTRIA